MEPTTQTTGAPTNPFDKQSRVTMPSRPVANLTESVRRLLGTLVSIVETRVSVLATDIQEARAHFVAIVVVAALAVVSFAMAALLAVLFVVAMFWDSHRLVSIGGLIGIFTLAGTMLWLGMTRRVKATHDLFSGTRTELRRDGEQLGMRGPRG